MALWSARLVTAVSPPIAGPFIRGRAPGAAVAGPPPTRVPLGAPTGSSYERERATAGRPPGFLLEPEEGIAAGEGAVPAGARGDRGPVLAPEGDGCGGWEPNRVARERERGSPGSPSCRGKSHESTSKPALWTIPKYEPEEYRNQSPNMNQRNIETNHQICTRGI